MAAERRLLELLDDASDEVVYRALEVLWMVQPDPDTAIPVIVPFLNHTNSRVRIGAFDAIGITKRNWRQSRRMGVQAFAGYQQGTGVWRTRARCNLFSRFGSLQVEMQQARLHRESSNAAKTDPGMRRHACGRARW